MLLFLYQLAFPFIALGIVCKLLLAGRGRALQETFTDLRQRLGFPSTQELGFPRDKTKTVWIHAASLGEVSAIEPVLRLLSQEDDPPRILLTTSTVAGRRRAKELPVISGAVLAPMDFYPAVCAFLKRVPAHSLILVETELWPMWVHLAQRRKIRLGIANGRITERAFRRYLWIRGWMKSWLPYFERAAIQTQEDARRFSDLGLPTSTIACTGNTKYDQKPPTGPIKEEADSWLGSLGWGQDPYWLAASIHKGEVEILYQAHRQLLRKWPRLRWVLAPRHPERSREIARLLPSDLNCAFLSELEQGNTPQAPAATAQCLVIDRLGVLGGFYAKAHACFVGGTLIPVGGHNLLEPAQYSCPVLFGPYTQSTREAALALQACRGGVLVQDADALARNLLGFLEKGDNRLKAGQRALEAAQSFSGAAKRTLDHLRPLMFASALPTEMV